MRWIVMAVVMVIVGAVYAGYTLVVAVREQAVAVAEVTAPIPSLVTIPQAESAASGPTDAEVAVALERTRQAFAVADAVEDGRRGTAAATRATLEARSIPDLAIKLADATMHALAPTAAFLVRATLPPGQADTPDLRRGMLLAANPQPRTFCGQGYDLRRTWPVTDVLVPCELTPGDGRVAYLLRYELTAAAAPPKL